MFGKRHPEAATAIPAVNTPAYDSRPLADALTTLSLDEIEQMIVNVTSLEAQIARLNIAGHEDAMMQVVTDGLNRLSYLLDAVKRHKEAAAQERKNNG